MIQISTVETSNLSQRHYKFVSSFLSGRLDFYIGVFNALGNGVCLNEHEGVAAKYNLKIVSIYSLINPLLNPKFKKEGKKVNIDESDIEAVLKRADNTKIDMSIDISKFKIMFDFFNKVKDNIEAIIVSPPDVLNKFIEDNTFYEQNDPLIKQCIEKIFSYETFSNKGFQIGSEIWDTYKLSSALNLSVCAYCNRNWIITVTKDEDDDKIVNPQMDHFLSKDSCPIFRLSMYNLIPSCDTCNSRLKGSSLFKYGENLHPFEEGYDPNAYFKTIAKNVESSIGGGYDFSVSLNFGLISEATRNKIKNNHDIFKIKEIYEKHGDIISELYLKRYLYSETYIDTLKTTLKEVKWSTEEIYKLAFGNYYHAIDFKKRPFAKITKDIAMQLGLLKTI